MDKKNIIKISIVIVLILISFYSGIIFSKNKSPMKNTNFSQNNMHGNTPRNNGTFLNGEIISKDENSITIKLLDGGSKILFLDKNNLKINKTVPGSETDLNIGEQINATGVNNPDGSILTQTIQIRPNISKPVVK